TILSGDVGNNDGPNFANRTDNVYSVFNCTSARVIDGLTFSGGMASASTSSRCVFTSNQGGSNSGGGFNASFASPIFDHCRFYGNSAVSSGGAFRCDG